jgi:hypothetical protein
MLFCLRCNGDVTLHDEDVTFQLRISNDEWKKTKEYFIQKGFINSENQILNWDKRQYVSDSSKSRVARHRAKKNENIVDVTMCNVTVTPPEQNRTEQNRTDSEQIQKKNIVEKNIKAINEIFEHWQNVMNHKNSKLDEKRKSVIKKAFKSGYSTDEIKEAITGCSLTPHNMGKNKNGQIYDGIALILKNSDQIDRFIANSKNPPAQNSNNQATGINNARPNTYESERARKSRLMEQYLYGNGE